MTVKKRVHIIDRKTLRANRSANDNEPVKGFSGEASSLKCPETPDKTCPASQARKHYGLPDPTEFPKPGLLGLVLDRFLALDAACDEFHHKVARNGIVGRYQHALDLANDPEAFATWKLEPRILGLSRKPGSVGDICRALFQASHRDPKTASKRWKRIEHLWKERAPASKVAAFLSTRNLNDPQRPKEQDDSNSKAASRPKPESSDNGRGFGDKVQTPKASKAVHVSNLPMDLISRKQIGDFVALGGVILEKEGNHVRLQLHGAG